MSEQTPDVADGAFDVVTRLHSSHTLEEEEQERRVTLLIWIFCYLADQATRQLDGE